MKYLRRFLILTVFLLLFLMAGCTGQIGSMEINTVLSVDHSFKGERLMTAQIPAVVYSRVFDKDSSTLKKVIDDYSPGDMYCTVKEQDSGGAVIEMHIDFASAKEYQKEITTICQGNKAKDAVKPVVTFDYSASALKNGYTISENFDSLALFYWLSDAIAAEYPAYADMDLENVFTLGSTRLVLDGEEIDLQGADIINVSTIDSHAFESIRIIAALGEDESIDAEIEYVVSNKVVADLGDKLEKLMQGIVPKDGTLLSFEGDTARTYKLKFSSANLQSYTTAMNKALGTNNTLFTVSSGEESENFAGSKDITMYYDGSYFLDFTDKKANMTYVLKVPSNYTVESCKGAFGYLGDYDATYSENYCEITMALTAPDEIKASLGFVVDINSVDIKTTVNSEWQIERTITFKLATDADKVIGDRMKARFDTVKAKWPEQMSVDSNSLISSVEHSITMKAESVDQITEMTRAVLGESDLDSESTSASQAEHSRMTGGEEPRTNPLQIRFSLEDTLNFSKFLEGSKVTEGINYELTFPLRYRANFSENTAFEEVKTDGQTISCISYNKILSVRSTAVKYNIQGIVILLLWVISFVICAIIVFIDFTPILRFLQRKDTGEEAQQLLHGKRKVRTTLLIIFMVCFVIMSVRLIFKIY